MQRMVQQLHGAGRSVIGSHALTSPLDFHLAGDTLHTLDVSRV